MKNRFIKLTAWALTLAMAFVFMLPVWAEDATEPGGSLGASEPILKSCTAELKDENKYDITLTYIIPDPSAMKNANAKNSYIVLNSCDFQESSSLDSKISVESKENILTIVLTDLVYIGKGNSLSGKLGFTYEDEGGNNHIEQLDFSTFVSGSGINVNPGELAGASKFVGYQFVSPRGEWIVQNSKVCLRLYVMDTDLATNPNLAKDLKGLYLSLNDCSFTYYNGKAPSTPGLNFYKDGMFSFIIDNIQYTGTGKNLSVELGYRLNGVDKTCPISAIINECIEYTEPEPEEPPSSSDPIVLDSLKPNILLESFAFRSERKPAADSSEESGAQSSSESSASGEPESAAEQGPENIISAGTPFDLSFSLKNTSRNIAVQNMVIKVDGGEKFRLQSGTDTLYVETLAPQASSSQTLSFNTPANTEPGSYPVTLSVSFEYYDKDAKLAGEASLSLSLPVGSVDRIRFNSLSVPMENYVGNDVSLSYSIINAGFTTLYNAEILVYDDTDTLLASKYVGTVEPSKEIKGNDISLNFMSAGDYNLRMVFQYEERNAEGKQLGTKPALPP